MVVALYGEASSASGGSEQATDDDHDVVLDVKAEAPDAAAPSHVPGAITPGTLQASPACLNQDSPNQDGAGLHNADTAHHAAPSIPVYQVQIFFVPLWLLACGHCSWRFCWVL